MVKCESCKRWVDETHDPAMCQIRRAEPASQYKEMPKLSDLEKQKVTERPRVRDGFINSPKLSKYAGVLMRWWPEELRVLFGPVVEERDYGRG